MADMKPEIEPANIPVIDFSLLSSSEQDHVAALRQIDDAFQTFGFIYLNNHTIPQEMVEEAFSWQSKRFFDLPHDVKQLIAHPPNADDHRGFAEVGLGLVSQGIWDAAKIEEIRKSAPPEQKEILEMGNPYNSDDPKANPFPNRLLPEDCFPGFQDFIKKWWDQCINLENQLIRCLCEIIGVSDRDYLAKQQTPGANRSHMSWLHYLSMPLHPLRERDASRLNVHTDFGQLTLLFQDSVGGLEIHDEEANIFRPVLPKPGTVIVHVGDMLEKQSNGRWKSALHQVTAPSQHMYGNQITENSVVDRYSVAFYVMPDYDLMMEPLPGCEDKGKWKSLAWDERMTAGDWMRRRVALEYEQQNKALVA
ncbi:MAG: hypothetical protein Q9226_003355 [Calogaya cf. arnoldii]